MIYWMKSSQVPRVFATYEEWYEHIREYTKQMKLMALSKESDPNAVTLATLHSSKGLEFEKRVYN